MTLRRFGPNGRPVSKLGIGAMSFSNFYGPATREDAFAVIDAAQDVGVNHIDTANVYGNGVSESHIGAYFAANPAAKDHFVTATKGSITDKSDPTRPFRNDKAYLEAELDASLARLGLDFVDLYYVHRRDKSIPIEEVAETLDGFVKAGKIGAFGFSEISPTSLRAAQSVAPIGAIQSEYSLSTRTPELGVLQSCASSGTAFVAFSPVGRSLLTDQPHSLATVQDMPFLKNNPRFMDPNLGLNHRAVDAFRSYAADLGLTAGGLAIAWVVAQGDHIVAIPGTRSPDRLRDMAKGADHGLSAAELSEIDRLLPMGWCSGDRYSDAQWNGPERYA